MSLISIINKAANVLKNITRYQLLLFVFYIYVKILIPILFKTVKLKYILKFN